MITWTVSPSANRGITVCSLSRTERVRSRPLSIAGTEYSRGTVPACCGATSRRRVGVHGMRRSEGHARASEPRARQADGAPRSVRRRAEELGAQVAERAGGRFADRPPEEPVPFFGLADHLDRRSLV